MRDIKFVISIYFLVLTLTLPAFARDEDWGIFQFRKRLDGGHQIFAEYVRRDRGELFSQKFLDLYRLSWGGKLGDWTYLIGGAYVDFNIGADERRLHQFGIYNFTKENTVSGVFRTGLEERSFISDDFIYFRYRNRIQLNLLPQHAFGFSIYDEIFYVPDGRNKFSSGFNENRLGIGFRYVIENLEFYIFNTTGYMKTPKSSDRFEWLQLQTIFSF
ncbi:MAG: DUF2490 domain-containing protein [Bdellovibrionaceae bacterium]|nr:DUF2490 domain-containing protein [Pseudobdellovibrionaceae bacterium]